ncbi:hypothetical protein B0H13DRAFT_2368565 [Mycena leptocephala]|nr:hypothetical protein B0H13DRAFT_2368565 [Mycena leptocephala]
MVVTAFNVTAVTVFLVFYNDPRRTLWITARNAAQESRFDSIETPFAQRARPESDNPTIDVVVGIDCTHEKAYVDGLDLIYSHFLTPIIASLETSQPLLRRSDLASVFSNFVDIWNLRRAFYASLSDLFVIIERRPSPTLTRPAFALPVSLALQPVRDRLPSTLSSMVNLASPDGKPPQSSSQPGLRCVLACARGRPPLRQAQAPASLNAYIDPEDLEHAQLTASHTLVSKSDHTHPQHFYPYARTDALAVGPSALDTEPALPAHRPGRTLVRRGPLSHIERSAQPRDREFLLFSDCIVWLEAEEGRRQRQLHYSEPERELSCAHTPRHDTNAEQERGGTSPAQCEWGDHTRDARSSLYSPLSENHRHTGNRCGSNPRNRPSQQLSRAPPLQERKRSGAHQAGRDQILESPNVGIESTEPMAESIALDKAQPMAPDLVAQPAPPALDSYNQLIEELLFLLRREFSTTQGRIDSY